MRQLFDKVSDWAVDYRASLEYRPAAPSRSYADCLERFSQPLPEKGQNWNAIIGELLESRRAA